MTIQPTDEQLARAELVIEGNHPWIVYSDVLFYFGLDDSFLWTAESLSPYVQSYLETEDQP